MKNKKVKGRAPEAFKTFPLADDSTRDPVSNATMPSIENVERAKDFVETNKK